MKIVINHKTNTVPFEKIKNGEVFLFSGSYLMKIVPIIDEYNNAYNAVDLRTGDIIFVNPIVEYEPVAATLKINFGDPVTTVAVRGKSEGVVN